MPAYPFTVRQLQVFERLCEVRSFRLASEELGISQASVSNQLKALEQQMGVRLLARESGSRPRLTPEGSAFLADLEQFWEAARTLSGHRKSGDQGREEAPTRLRVFIGNYLLKDYIRPKLGRFFESHPTIQLEFATPTISEHPRDMIARESFDLGLYQEPLDNPLNTEYRELAQVRCGVFGHFKHIDRRNAPLGPEEISAIPFLLPPAGSPYEDEILRMLASHGIQPTQIMGRTPFFDVMSSMFDRGTCVGVTIEPLLREEHRNTVLLRHLANYRLVLYRNPRATGPSVQAAEDFLTSAVLGDPQYPRAETLTGD